MAHNANNFATEGTTYHHRENPRDMAVTDGVGTVAHPISNGSWAT
jgi:hypothetical protein